LSSMKERCLFIYAEQVDSTWHLHYLLKMKLYDDRDYYRVYTGGIPLMNADINTILKKYDWHIPKDLNDFYKIHNGFGEIYNANFVMSNNDIRVMGEMMNPICKEQNSFPENYKFDDLLEFFPDGAGNAQCFYRYKPINNLTVDWDHETWEISNQMGFFEFINQRMSEIDEE
ncbi:MAG: SMI1/KNR4 family protein, partial [Bacteroidales bacterium]|nr:SMI1/KNR4 family protein [Bacteroidales bacterium]